jgi:Golgi phosphoprotein 3 (GPP34)
MSWFSAPNGAHAQAPRGGGAGGQKPPEPPRPPALPSLPARQAGSPAMPQGGAAAGQQADIRIADDFFLIAHRDRDGKPLLPGRVMGLALASAALCELALVNRITLHEGAVVVVSDDDPGDELRRALLQQLLSQPNPLPLRDWLAYLASSVTVAVGERLARAGTVEARKGLRGWRFVPVDSANAFFRAGRLAVVLDNGGQLSPAQSVLVGLIHAAGLLEQLPCVDPAPVRGRVTAIMQGLKWPLAGLIAETTVVVNNAIATGRI